MNKKEMILKIGIKYKQNTNNLIFIKNAVIKQTKKEI